MTLVQLEVVMQLRDAQADEVHARHGGDRLPRHERRVIGLIRCTLTLLWGRTDLGTER